jgi:PBP1b-binding outer membrane lipoprotein LpoB
MKRGLSLIFLALFLCACSPAQDWRDASRESAGIAPDPAATPEAVLQVYGADAWGWR